jgi:hypothetical protein
MKLRATRGRKPGQSIPLIALMIVVLVGMVALSVDVGNTYSQQRHVVRTAEAASIVAMQRYQETQANDTLVHDSIIQSFHENGITAVPFTKTQLADNERRVRAYYLGPDGNEVSGCSEVGTCANPVYNASYIHVQVEGEVETYFARLLGQDEMPVHAQAFAGLCPPINGMMPLTVNHDLIDDNGRRFRPEVTDGTIEYSDLFMVGGSASYKDLHFGNPINLSTHIGVLRWRENYDATDLSDMLAGEGTLKLGFEEVQDWPGDPTKEFANYPAEPFYLTDMDWVYGLRQELPSNLSLDLRDTDVQNLLDYHIQNRNKVILPLYNSAVSSVDGSNDPAYFIGQFGEFYVVDYDRTNSEWLRLAFIRYAPRIPCPSENVNVPQKFGLRGNVSLTPRWMDPSPDWEPAAYTIMLDVSGSMNMSVEGLGRRDGQTYQCESYDPNGLYPFSYDPEEGLPYDGGDCSKSPPAAPGQREERRAFVARQAILDLVSGMDPLVPERLRIITFDGSVQDTSPEWYAPNANGLDDHVLAAGEDCRPSSSGPTQGIFSPCFFTGGGTNGASAMKRGWDYMIEADGQNFPTDQNGNDLHRVAIYMTDGVSRECGGLDGCKKAYRAECDNMDAGARRNTPFCWTGRESNGDARPITFMGDLSQEMHEDIEVKYDDAMQFFVLAMGLIDVVGLDDVATHPNMVYAARSVDQVRNMMLGIQTRVEEDSCIPRLEDPVTWIGGQNVPDPGFLPAAGVYGTAELWQGSTFVQEVDITNIDQMGRLGFYIPPNEGLVPGMYHLKNFRVFYNPSGRANGTETYTRIRIDSMDATVVEVAIVAEDILGDTAKAPDVLLDLSLDDINDMDCEDL